jgi:hypothetical protein
MDRVVTSYQYNGKNQNFHDSKFILVLIIYLLY